LVSRVLGPRAGAAFTFAAPDEGAETAPGQVSARTLLDLYRLDQLDQATRIFGVAGNPIAHSLSPLMHNTAFRRESVNAVMLPLKVRALNDLLTVVTELPLGGVAVTMPLKTGGPAPPGQHGSADSPHRGLQHAADRGGRQNLWIQYGRGWCCEAPRKADAAEGRPYCGSGAGGAARAAVFGLVEQGAEVFVVNRTHEKAVALSRKAHAKSLKQELLAKNKFDALINTTPCGMAGIKQALPIEENELNASLVFDMVYNPLDTPLLRLAKDRG